MGNCCRPGWWHLQLPSPKTWGSLLFWDVKKYLIDDKKMTNFGALFIKRREVRGWQKNVSKYLFLFTLFKNTHTFLVFTYIFWIHMWFEKKKKLFPEEVRTDNHQYICNTHINVCRRQWTTYSKKAKIRQNCWKRSERILLSHLIGIPLDWTKTKKNSFLECVKNETEF